MSDAEQRAARTKEMLRRVAGALGRSEHTFFDGSTTTPEVAETVELLQIWESLRTTTDRRKVLAFARGIAGRPDGLDEVPAAAG